MAAKEKGPIKTIIRLIILSLIVGMILSFFGITPANFWTSVGGFFKWLFDLAVGFLGWGLIYIIIGAAVVVPIFLFNRWRKSRRNTPNQ